MVFHLGISTDDQLKTRCGDGIGACRAVLKSKDHV